MPILIRSHCEAEPLCENNVILIKIPFSPSSFLLDHAVSAHSLRCALRRDRDSDSLGSNVGGGLHCYSRGSALVEAHDDSTDAEFPSRSAAGQGSDGIVNQGHSGA